MKAFWRFKSIFLTELTVIFYLIYIQYVLPKTATSLQQWQGTQNGIISFQYIYIAFDIVFNWLYEFVMAQVEESCFLINQIQYGVLGIRLTVLFLGNNAQFSFWYLVILLLLQRINIATMTWTVFARRFLYYKMPATCKEILGMRENAFSIKVKNGFSIECLSWICYLILFQYTGTIPVFKVLKPGMICLNCAMGFEWTYLSNSAKIIIVWLFFFFGEMFSVYLNKKNGYDNIKIRGSDGMGLL